jgi:hypothetical protein
MKKFLASTICFAVISAVCSFSGFSQSFKNGDKLLNVGLGLNSYYTGMPIGASYEVGITDAISVGGMFDYNSGKFASSYGFTAFYLGARGSYHVNELFKINNDKIDLYGGLGLGYQNFKWSDATYSGTSYNSGVYLNYFIGGKYYFNNNISGMLELGSSGLSGARIGVGFKL